MKLLSEKIRNVRIREIVAGFDVSGTFTPEPQTVAVEWFSEWDDKFYQVYVNGRFAGATCDTSQRSMIVHTSKGIASIEVFAVEPAWADEDMSSELSCTYTGEGRARIGWLRTQELPIGAVLNFYTDYGTGLIKYDAPLNPEPVRVWPCLQDKGGFGAAGFGIGDFGYDAGGSAGFGLSGFGYGIIGIGAEEFFWISGRLNEGWYRFAVEIIEEGGGSNAAEISEAVYIRSGPEPAKSLRIESFDSESGNLTFNII